LCFFSEIEKFLEKQANGAINLVLLAEAQEKIKDQYSR